ncbi:expressed unknown protein [Seminavis robusta]|uniref:Uncharacterized protein n=1 Tax=Seminavis robusta TaxID=568900 RepID=A0A9N8EUN4_9STRA|nr:expressed unknown protein [Seminavis robusta]|eukprot:Sro1733_g294250.1 n/a (172) ;mRNA; r:9058-9573
MKVFTTITISFLFFLFNVFSTSLAQSQMVGSPESLYPIVVNVRDPMAAKSCPIQNDKEPRSLLFELTFDDNAPSSYSFELQELQTGCKFKAGGTVPKSVDVSIQVDGLYLDNQPIQVTLPDLSMDTILNVHDFLMTVDDVTNGHRVAVASFRGPLSSAVVDGVVTFHLDLD